jgi:DNA polymerase III epsilon subunit-like protein
LAAHNVRFDHGFLKSEYRRLGTVLRHKVMCTIKLSRTLYPHHAAGESLVISRNQSKLKMMDGRL